MKRYLFLAVALLGLASCAKDDIANGNNPIHNGEIEESYIAINLSASDVTRADGGVYVVGAEAERAVKTAHFFFFKDGAPFPVNITNGTVTSPGGTINHLSATLNGNTSGMNNVSDIKDVVLLLSSYKGEYPNQIIAVLNWNPEPTKAYYLSELETAVNIATKYEGTDYFVMSNAVYAAGDKVMDATPLTEDNIKTSETDAKAAPVKIYVERVAAKVVVTTADGTTKINLNKPVSTNQLVGGVNTLVETPVYAQLLGWELHNDIPQSYLLKQIDPTWEDMALGFTWNDAPWFRSYWATSLLLPTPNPVVESFKMSYATPLPAGFATQYGFAIGNNVNVGTANETAKSFTYVGENTNGQAAGTKVILKAKLVDEDDNTLEIASWYGNKYIGEESLRTAVANTLKYTLYYHDVENSKYVGIMPEDLQCVAGGTADAPAGVDANEVYFQLSTAGKTKDWYKLVNGEYQNVANDLANDAKSVTATNAYLKSIQPGILYKNGETFYYVDIKHLGAEGSLAEYGVVRNHIYNIVINSIGGYGSPIYVGTSNLVTPGYPDTPDAEETFVSAQINILSWRLVNQEVDIQPNN